MSADAEQPDKYFPSTSWTLLGVARGASTQAHEARNEFARRYRQPVLNYFAALTRDRSEAEELAQGFFEKLADSGGVVAGADRSRGRFRHYLKRALSNHWKSWIRSQHQHKRDRGLEVHPDGWTGSGWDQLDLHAQGTPEAAFHAGWVRSLLDDALKRVRIICKQKKQTEHYELFLGRYLCDATEPPSWRELGAKFGLDEKAARSKTETVARHFRLVLRDILREEGGSEESVDEELSALLALL